VNHIKELKRYSNYIGYNESVDGCKKLIQIIDMSDSMLYTEAKAEQSFLTLINATVSHELRNPLVSIIGSRDNLKEILKGL
jgi:signal transduction histidine kinase